MKDKKQMGRPKKLDRVRTTVNLDRDLRDWTKGKDRSLIINMLLRDHLIKNRYDETSNNFN